MIVDPLVRKLAEVFVDCTLFAVREDAVVMFTQQREALVERAAKAIQQAVEDEMTALRRELMA